MMTQLIDVERCQMSCINNTGMICDMAMAVVSFINVGFLPERCKKIPIKLKVFLLFLLNAPWQTRLSLLR